MDPRTGVLTLIFVCGCSGAPLRSSAARAPVAAGARATERAAVGQRGAPEEPPAARNAQSENAFDYEHQTDADQAYLDETRRAIELYQAFIERAGDDPQYRAAVKRSREQIEDLTNARIFVEDGRGSRAKAAQ
jgi:hypothetical protein